MFTCRKRERCALHFSNLHGRLRSRHEKMWRLVRSGVLHFMLPLLCSATAIFPGKENVTFLQRARRSFCTEKNDKSPAAHIIECHFEICAFALTCTLLLARSNKKGASDIISTSLRLNVNTLCVCMPRREWHLHFPFAYYARQ
jgi:hypothetical protein